MKQKNKVFSVILMAVLLYFAFYFINKSAVLQIITSESSYLSYYVQNDKVYFSCKVTVINDKNDEEKFSLCAEMNDDYKSGLLKNPDIYAFSNEKKEIFDMKPNTQQTYDVVFVGVYGGNLQEADNSLPQIEIISVKN